MRNFHYFIDPVDSVGRCPCSKCGHLPVITGRSDGKWIGFCPKCHLKKGFDDLPQNWFADNKDDAIFSWSARQLIWDICKKTPEGVK